MCTCNPTYSIDELTYQFKNSGSKIVATVLEILHTVREAAERAGIDRVIVVDTSEPAPHRSGDGLLSYLNMVNDSGSRFSPVKMSPEDVAVLPYSSGTTGLPKGVMLTNLNLASNMAQMQHEEYLDLRHDGTCLSGLPPFCHMYGLLMIIFLGMHCGCKSVTMSKFEPELFLSSIEKHKITVGFLVPPLILFLAKHPLVCNYDISCLSNIISVADPLKGMLIEEVKKRIVCSDISQGYGLTETSLTHTQLEQFKTSKPDSVGHPVRSMLAKIVNPETGESLPAGEEVELWLSGPNVMKGYLNLPDATRDSITSDGWFKTGDIGKTCSLRKMDMIPECLVATIIFSLSLSPLSQISLRSF